MLVKHLIHYSVATGALVLLMISLSSSAWACSYGGCSYDNYSSDNRCGRYSCGTDSYTNPTICDSGCPDRCDLLCDHNNTKYRGCGDNCIMP